MKTNKATFLEACKDFDACIGTKINPKCHQIKWFYMLFDNNAPSIY